MKKISNKQHKANKNNAKKGGVKSPEGKKIVRYNATKHGIYSTRNILPSESPRVFSKLAKNIFKDLSPVGVMEEMLVQKIVSIVWRQRRLLMFDTGMANNKELQDYWYKLYQEHFHPFNLGQMQTVNRYETTLDKALYRAIRELRTLQKERENKQK